MRSQITLGRIFGIEIGLHYSWFLIALLIVLSLYQQFSIGNSEWGTGLILTLAVSTGILFFISLLLHELSHSLYARSHGMPVRQITLFALGGVSQIEKSAPNARSEFWMAFVGPLTSAVIGLACLGLRTTASDHQAPAYVMLSWLGYINLALAAFNMVPGYPLDGGRILRAALWWKSGNMERATATASRVGQVVGGIFIALGLLQFFAGAGFGGLWMAFIGWFLLQAAGESRMEATVTRALEGKTVGDLMTSNCPSIDGNQNVQNFVDEWLLRTGNRCFIVMGNDGLAGLITPAEVKAIDRARWPYTTLFDIMRPLQDVRTVAPDTPLRSALEIMGRQDVNQLPVLSNGRVAGVLSRAQLLNYLHTRAELHI